MELDVQKVVVAAREITRVNSQWTYEREGGSGVELAVLHLEDRSFVTFGIDALIEALTNLRDSSRDQARQLDRNQQRLNDVLTSTVRDTVAPSLDKDADPDEVARAVVAAGRRVGEIVDGAR